MNRHPFKYLLALAGAGLLAGAAAAGPIDFKSDYLPLERNLAFELNAPGAVRANVQIAGKDLGEGLKFDLATDEHGIFSGGVYAPPGESRFVTVTALDARGRAIYKGESLVNVDKELTPEFDVPLGGKELKDPLQARFGSTLLTAGIVGGDDDLLKMQLALKDPFGKNVPYSPEDIYWELPEGFPEIKYSCFDGALCILEWKPTRLQEAIYLCLKIKPKPCVTTPPIDYRGPYKYVAVGRQHTCALTKDDEIRCWGDNFWGQLGTATAQTCVFGTCSFVPVPVTCPTGEICKFRSLAAGGDHTCAVDTNGKAWCWGDEGNPAAGRPAGTPNKTSPVHRRVPAFNRVGTPADFVAIDTHNDHSCGLSAAGDVYCWGHDEEAQLGFPPVQIPGPDKFTFNATLLQTGSTYKQVAVGHRHSCALQTNGQLDCWGSNAARQIVFNTLPFGALVTVNGMVPLLNKQPVSLIATGFGDTCAQNASNNLVCWGSPDQSLGFARSSFNALTGAFSRSIASDFDNCGNGTVMCTRTCAVSFQWGDLSCGRWVNNSISTLTQLNDPKHYYHVSIYTQVDVGLNHACAVNTQGDILCFGKNPFGQFGTGYMSSVRVDDPDLPAVR